MNAEISIVNLREIPECLEKIGRWHHDQWSYLNPQRTFETRLARMREHLLGKPIPTTWVATQNGEVVGSAALIVSDMPERPELKPWLASVFVRPSSRHQGIGRRVVSKVMSHAKASGVKILYLYTPDKEHFYKHMGWQTLEKTVYHGADITIMKYCFDA